MLNLAAGCYPNFYLKGSMKVGKLPLSADSFTFSYEQVSMLLLLSRNRPLFWIEEIEKAELWATLVRT